jgi:hypothetical protein
MPAHRLGLKLNEIEALENEAAMSAVRADAASLGYLLHGTTKPLPPIELELDFHMVSERDGGGLALHGRLLTETRIWDSQPEHWKVGH